MNSLGYGPHMIIDGYGASAPLLDEGWVIGTAYGLLGTLSSENGDPVKVSHWFPDGVSVALVLPEAHLTLHTFAGRRLACLGMFSPQLLSAQNVTRVFQERFGVGRLEGQLGSRSVVLHQDGESAFKYLMGERSYADVRLDESLLEV